MTYLDLMQNRIAEMIKVAGEDAQEQIRLAMPEDPWFLSQPRQTWARGLMEERDLVVVGLGNALLTGGAEFPLVVEEANPYAWEALNTPLETWLSLVVPRELD